MLLKAIEFAIRKHRGQVRKGSDAPYVTHPLEVMNILMTNGFSEHVCVAGLLHDTIEDTETTYEEILKEFGARVAALVVSHTDDPTKSWEERKSIIVQKLSTTRDREEAALVFADALSNLRSTVRDYEEVGEAVWNRFDRGKVQQFTYYLRIFNAGCRLVDKPMYGEYARLYAMITAGKPKEPSCSDEELSYMMMTTAQELIDDPADRATVFGLCKRVADRYSNDEAELATGLLYQTGRGVEKNPYLAFRYLELAVRHGNADAPALLAPYYVNGDLVERDFEFAKGLYELSIARGGQFDLQEYEMFCYALDNGLDYHVVSDEHPLNLGDQSFIEE